MDGQLFLSFPASGEVGKWEKDRITRDSTVVLPLTDLKLWLLGPSMVQLKL
jgi:hypothetical protein